MELELVGLGLMGVECLLGLPALEEPEARGPIDILGPPVVDTSGILAAALRHGTEGGHRLLPLLGPEVQVAGECVHEDPRSVDRW